MKPEEHEAWWWLSKFQDSPHAEKEVPVPHGRAQLAPAATNFAASQPIFCNADSSSIDRMRSSTQSVTQSQPLSTWRMPIYRIQSIPLAPTRRGNENTDSSTHASGANAGTAAPHEVAEATAAQAALRPRQHLMRPEPSEAAPLAGVSAGPGSASPSSSSGALGFTKLKTTRPLNWEWMSSRVFNEFAMSQPLRSPAASSSSAVSMPAGDFPGRKAAEQLRAPSSPHTSPYLSPDVRSRVPPSQPLQVSGIQRSQPSASAVENISTAASTQPKASGSASWSTGFLTGGLWHRQISPEREHPDPETAPIEHVSVWSDVHSEPIYSEPENVHTYHARRDVAEHDQEHEFEIKAQPKAAGDFVLSPSAAQPLASPRRNSPAAANQSTS